MCDRLETPPVQEVRAHGADANHDALVAEQREEELERRPLLTTGEGHPHGRQRVVVRDPELIGDGRNVARAQQCDLVQGVVDRRAATAVGLDERCDPAFGRRRRRLFEQSVALHRAREFGSSHSSEVSNATA